MSKATKRPKSNLGQKSKMGHGDDRDYIYVPSGWDPEDYPDPIAKHPDAARWLLNCIYFKRVTRNKEETDYVNLSSRFLQTMMGGRDLLRPIRDALFEHELIECDDKYIPGEKSLGYRIGSAIAGLKWESWRGIGKRFAKRFEKYREWVRTPSGLVLPVHHHLHDAVMRTQLDGDVEPVIAGIEDPLRANSAAIQAELIHQGMIRTTVCKYGRFHTNYSGLCSEFRPLLKIDGRPLIEMDLRNSQPLELALLLREKIRGEMGNREGNSRREKTETQLIPYVSCLEELDRFIEVTTQGQFYESLISEDWPRDLVKDKVFQVIFGNRNVQTHCQIAKVFQKVWPGVYEALFALKEEYGFRWVGQTLQRMESFLVIDTVCERLRVEAPGASLLTVHDSIMTTEDHVDRVYRTMNEEFEKRFGIVPTIRIKGE